jgi:ABC-type multidrug transport system permease subunit
MIDGHPTLEPQGASYSLIQAPNKTINRRRQHRQLFLTEICWRLLATLVFSIIVTTILYSFAQKGLLSRWEKRWFNVLAIFFSSLVSLSVGSLLNILGSMLRWPLLARKLHTPTDVRRLYE